MSADRFDACLAETLHIEGGWSNHAKDRGGPTMRGVIQRVYDAWRIKQGLPRQSVRNITEAEWRAIYRAEYWDTVRADALPAGLDLAVFDFGVNSGPARAVRYLQACLKVNQDGHMGPVTIEAANQADTRDLIAAYMRVRRKCLRGLSDYRYFGKGWENRCNYIEPAALNMAGAARPVLARPLADPDAQSASQARATEEPARPSAAKIATTAAAAASGIATVAPQAIAPPPAALRDSVTNIGLWQSIGEQIASFGKFLLGHPVEVTIIASLVAVVWFGPRLLPHIWSRQT